MVYIYLQVMKIIGWNLYYNPETQTDNILIHLYNWNVF